MVDLPSRRKHQRTPAQVVSSASVMIRGWTTFVFLFSSALLFSSVPVEAQQYPRSPGGAARSAENSPQLAESLVVVTSADSEEAQRLQLSQGQSADITVYLASLGDLVENFLVTLRRDTDNQRLRALLSDQHGVVVFEEVPPGSYRVEVSRKVKDDGDLSSVRVGDFRLTITGARQAH